LLVTPVETAFFIRLRKPAAATAPVAGSKSFPATSGGTCTGSV
jgi:hypothetical protein